MTIPPWIEVQLAIGGALKLARGDRRGLGFFDYSLEGFWRSFRAAAICFPFYLALLSFRMAAPQWAQFGIADILVVETIAYVISWVAFPLVVLPVTRWLDRESRFLVFMVVYNWCQVPQTVLFFMIGIDGATGLVPRDIVQFADLIATAAVLLYEWYIARVTLSLPGAFAVLIVLIDLVLGTALSRLAEALY